MTVLEPYYLVPMGNNLVDSPLPAGRFLTVGYGTGGSVPFAFHLRDGKDIDVGFLKLFMTTSPIEFGSLEQPSPFQKNRSPLSKTDTIQKLRELSEDWATDVTAIIQRSRPRPIEAPLKHPSPTSKGWFAHFLDFFK